MRCEMREKEKVVLETRKHWLILAKPVFIFLLSLVITFFVYAKGSAEYKNWQYINYLENVMILVTVVSILYILYKYWDYMTNLWIVTNVRVLDEWGVFTRNLKETPLEKINNLSLRQSLLGRIFVYGDIEIQSAAEDGATLYTFVKSPEVLVHTISTLSNDKEREEQITKQNSRESTMNFSIYTPQEQENKKESFCPYCGMCLKGTEEVVEEKNNTPENKGV